MGVVCAEFRRKLVFVSGECGVLLVGEEEGCVSDGGFGFRGVCLVGVKVGKVDDGVWVLECFVVVSQF